MFTWQLKCQTLILEYKDLYAMIKQEMEAIQREGYDVVLIVGSAF